MQLRRCLRKPDIVQALRQCAAILVGGAATDAALLKQGQELGLNLVTTYGMTETSGGCVYNGRPLPGTKLRLDQRGCLQISTPSLMCGYLEDEPATFPPGVTGESWFSTNDLAEFVPATLQDVSSRAKETCAQKAPDRATVPLQIDSSAPWRLRIQGRVDEVINSGGEKIALPAVLAALNENPNLRGLYQDAWVLKADHRKWGQVVSIVVSSSIPAAQLGPRLREDLANSLPRYALPKEVIVLPQLPQLPSGKVDRLSIEKQAALLRLTNDPAQVWSC